MTLAPMSVDAIDYPTWHAGSEKGFWYAAGWQDAMRHTDGNTAHTDSHEASEFARFYAQRYLAYHTHRTVSLQALPQIWREFKGLNK